jgi:MoaA/NifB/PqqE/SkfB family radical SAM enzyme
MRFEEIIIELSFNCNLSCIMCGFGKDTNSFNKDKFFSFNKYKTILHQIGNKTKTIRLNGRGESTIHPDFVEILNYTKQHFPQLNINLFSNFSFNNKKVIDALIANGVQLFISMDSPKADELSAIRKGANFQFIENNIKQLQEMPNRPFVIFTIQEANINRIFEMAEFAFDNNCHILYNTIRRDEGVEVFIEIVKQNYQSILDQFKQIGKLYANSELQFLYPDQLAGVKLQTEKPTITHGTMKQCPALEKELCILYDGSTTPCNMFNPYIYGNIFNQSLNEIWESKERKVFLLSHKCNYYCQNCANLGV